MSNVPRTPRGPDTPPRTPRAAQPQQAPTSITVNMYTPLPSPSVSPPQNTPPPTPPSPARRREFDTQGRPINPDDVNRRREIPTRREAYSEWIPFNDPPQPRVEYDRDGNEIRRIEVPEEYKYKGPRRKPGDVKDREEYRDFSQFHEQYDKEKNISTFQIMIEQMRIQNKQMMKDLEELGKGFEAYVNDQLAQEARKKKEECKRLAEANRKRKEEEERIAQEQQRAESERRAEAAQRAEAERRAESDRKAEAERRARADQRAEAERRSEAARQQQAKPPEPARRPAFRSYQDYDDQPVGPRRAKPDENVTGACALPPKPEEPIRGSLQQDNRSQNWRVNQYDPKPGDTMVDRVRKIPKEDPMEAPLRGAIQQDNERDKDLISAYDPKVGDTMVGRVCKTPTEDPMEAPLRGAIQQDNEKDRNQISVYDPKVGDSMVGREVRTPTVNHDEMVVGPRSSMFGVQQDSGLQCRLPEQNVTVGVNPNQAPRHYEDRSNKCLMPGVTKKRVSYDRNSPPQPKDMESNTNVGVMLVPSILVQNNDEPGPCDSESCHLSRVSQRSMRQYQTNNIEYTGTSRSNLQNMDDQQWIENPKYTQVGEDGKEVWDHQEAQLDEEDEHWQSSIHELDCSTSDGYNCYSNAVHPLDINEEEKMLQSYAPPRNNKIRASQVVTVQNNEMHVVPTNSMVHDIEDLPGRKIIILEDEGTTRIVLRRKRKEHNASCPLAEHHRKSHRICQGDVRNTSLTQFKYDVTEVNEFRSREKLVMQMDEDGRVTLDTNRRDRGDKQCGEAEEELEECEEYTDEQYKDEQYMKKDEFDKSFEDDCCDDEDCEFHSNYERGPPENHLLFTNEEDPLDNLTTLENNEPGEIDVLELNGKANCDEEFFPEDSEKTRASPSSSQHSLLELPTRSQSVVFPVMRKLSYWMRNTILPDYKR